MDHIQPSVLVVVSVVGVQAASAAMGSFPKQAAEMIAVATLAPAVEYDCLVQPTRDPALGSMWAKY
jgi:hypothetical protein